MHILECLSLSLLIFFFGNVMSEMPGSSIEYCEGMMNYYMVDQKACPFAIYFGHSLPECVCVNGLYQIYYDDCSTKYARGEGYCFKSARSKGERLKSIQLVGPNDFNHPQVLIATQKSGEHVKLELIAGNMNNTFGFKTETRKFTFTELLATSSKIFTGIPTSSSDQKPALCIEPYRSPDYQCKAIGPMDDVELIITKSSCANEMTDPQEMDTEKCLPLKSDLDSECKLTCDAIIDNNFYDPNCTNWNDKLIFENSYYDRKMREHGLMTQLNELPYLAELKPKRTFDLFKQMAQITRDFCDEKYVQKSWIDHVVELFYVLYKGTEFQSLETMTEDDYTWITDILSQCSGANYFVNLTNKDPNEEENSNKPDNGCTIEGGRAWGYCGKNSTDKCIDAVQVLPYYEKIGNRLKTKHYTPEVAWNVLDAVQAICFREFNSSYRMFHILQQSVEKLFTPRIKDLWYNPAYLKNPLIKSRLFGAGSDETLANIEICIGAAYDIINKENKEKISPDATPIPRLVRPKHEKYLTRKKREVTLTPISRSTDAFCIKTKAQAPSWYSKDCSKITPPEPEVDLNGNVPTENTIEVIPGPPADYNFPDVNSETS